MIAKNPGGAIKNKPVEIMLLELRYRFMLGESKLAVTNVLIFLNVAQVVDQTRFNDENNILKTNSKAM
jgi:hypothetical protein